MAGDWLKVEASTPDKPEVFEISQQLKLSPEEAFGRLFLVWRWFDMHTENGNAVNVTSAYLNRIAGVAGFAEAMNSVGWLNMPDSATAGCSLPHFDYHNGKTAKSRALTAKRVATHKQRNGNAVLTMDALPREEKRRSKNNTPTVYDLGVALMVDQGLKETSSRSFVGSLLKEWEVGTVEEAFRSSTGKTDVRAYVLGVLKTKPKKGVNVGGFPL